MTKPKNPDYWGKAKRHLCKADPVLANIIRTYKGEALASRGSAFFSLARAIVGQQISVKAAESVWNKLAAAFSSPPPAGGRPGGGLATQHPTSPHPPPKGEGVSAKTILPPFRKSAKEEGVSAACIMETDVATLRACGLSGQKVIYLKELSQFFLSRGKVQWHHKSDEEVIADLISIKGIGKWSAEMFLIFHLMRADVFPIADLGLRKGIERHYNQGKKMDVKKMTKLAERWRPYRTVATWYLWRSLDPVPVEY